GSERIERADDAAVRDRQAVGAGGRALREPGPEPVLHLARAFAARRPEVEAACLPLRHGRAELGPQIGQGPAFPGTEAHLDQSRLDPNRRLTDQVAIRFYTGTILLAQQRRRFAA